MIATVFALAIGAFIGIGTMVIFAMALAYVQNEDNPPSWRNSPPNDSLGEELPNKPLKAQEPPYPK